MKYSHTIQIITKDIQDIEKLVDNFNNYSSIPAIEIDLALSKLRNIYDLLLLFKDAPVDSSTDLVFISETGTENNTPKPITLDEEVVIENPQVKPVPSNIDEQEIEKHTLNSVPTDLNKPESDIPRQESSPADKKEPALETPPNKSTPGIHENKKAEKEGGTLGERFKSEKKFINERFGEQSRRNDLKTKLQGTPITNIAGSIGINDKFYLIRELFKGNPESFRETMDILDHSPNFNEAFNYLIEHFDWDMESDSVQQLLALIRRKFISQRNE